MRENRMYGSEGREARAFLTPIGASTATYDSQTETREFLFRID
jgi:hypothetical protein